MIDFSDFTICTYNYNDVSRLGPVSVQVRRYEDDCGETWLGKMVAHPNPVIFDVLGGIVFVWRGGAYIDYAPCDEDVATVVPHTLRYIDTINVWNYEAGKANLPYGPGPFARKIADIDGDGVYSVWGARTHHYGEFIIM